MPTLEMEEAVEPEIQDLPPAPEAPEPCSLQVGLNDKLDVFVLINENKSGIGPLVFSALEARNLGLHLIQKAAESGIYTAAMAQQAQPPPEATG